ncbi:MAG: hypothetical protein [Bacteriophage sp.]|nr:MAG: hypothetical protein [Bacteriophage sp.]
MPIIDIQRLPGLPRERSEVDPGTNLLQWLSGQQLHDDITILHNGLEIGDKESIDFNLVLGDHVVIHDNAKSGDLIKTLVNPLEHFNPIKFTQKVFASLSGQQGGASVGATKTSPNTTLKQQTNIARNGEARPDNYGQVRAFPDLIQNSLEEYVNNIKYVTEFMNFGIGRYAISSVRYSESNIGSLAGASYAVYNPGENIGTIVQPYPFDDVDGQEVPGKNEGDEDGSTVVIESATTTNVVSAQYSGGQLQVVIIKNSDFDYFVDLAFPHSINFTVNVTYATPSGNTTQNVTLSGDLMSATQSNDAGVPPSVYYYTFTINNIQGTNASYIINGTINNTYFNLTDNQALTIGPFFSPVPSSQLWVNTNSGLGGNSEANWEVTIWKVDDDNVIIPGTLQSFSFRQTTPHDYTTETFYRTDKLYPAGGYGRYAVSFRRTDNSSDSSKLKVESINAINVRYNVVYPLETMIRVTVRATENATSSRDRKYNALITRHTISYDLNSGSIRYTLAPSRNFADAILHTWIIIAGLDASTLDIRGLYEIASRIPDARLGYFDYTFDDEDTSLGDRLQTICDAARVICFWDDGVLSFVRDERRDYPATVFNTRNMTSTQYSLSYDMTLPGGYDGVQVQYRDPITNKQAYVYYKVTGNSIAQGQPTKPKKFDMMYIRNIYQATDRAILECRRLLFQRVSMSLTAMSDGEWVNVGEMIQVIDMYDTNQQSGDIQRREGNVFYTNEAIRFTENMFVVVTDRMGNVSDRYRATPVAGQRKAFYAELPLIDLAIWDGVNVQSASRYAIATDEELERTQWVIASKNPGTDGTTSLSVTEYNDEMYNYTVI